MPEPMGQMGREQMQDLASDDNSAGTRNTEEADRDTDPAFGTAPGKRKWLAPYIAVMRVSDTLNGANPGPDTDGGWS